MLVLERSNYYQQITALAVWVANIAHMLNDTESSNWSQRNILYSNDTYFNLTTYDIEIEMTYVSEYLLVVAGRDRWRVTIWASSLSSRRGDARVRRVVP